MNQPPNPSAGRIASAGSHTTCRSGLHLAVPRGRCVLPAASLRNCLTLCQRRPSPVTRRGDGSISADDRAIIRPCESGFTSRSPSC